MLPLDASLLTGITGSGEHFVRWGGEDGMRKEEEVEERCWINSSAGNSGQSEGGDVEREGGRRGGKARGILMCNDIPTRNPSLTHTDVSTLRPLH